MHFVVYPECDGGSLPAARADVVMLPSRLLAGCLAHTRRRDGSHDAPAAVAALQWVVAHELAHSFLSHTVSAGLQRRGWCACMLGGACGQLSCPAALALPPLH